MSDPIPAHEDPEWWGSVQGEEQLLRENEPRTVSIASPVQQSDSLDKLANALVHFQGAVTGAGKGGTNPHFRSSYTRLEDAWKAAREALNQNGISVTQWPTSAERGVAVTTRVMHASGQWLQSTIIVGLDTSGSKNVAQQYGSTLTYAQRYAFLAALGLPPVDDDGQGAGPPKPPPSEPTGLAKGVMTRWENKLRKCKDMDDLKLAWGQFSDKCWADATEEQQDSMTAVKDECKSDLDG